MLAAPTPASDPVGDAPGAERRRMVGLDRRWWFGVAALSMTGVVLALGSDEVPADEGVVLCPFRRCTGGYCPGCGATRAASALVRGDLVGSIRLHPLVVVWAAQVVAAVVAVSLSPGTARRIARTWISGHLAAVVGINLAAAVVVWVVRLGTGTVPGPFGWL